MRRVASIALLIAVVAATFAAAPKDSDRPDKEMLQMMELLKNMEMLKQIDLMQDMQKIDSTSGAAAGGSSQKIPAVKKPEATK
jgi:tellurite resistance protein